MGGACIGADGFPAEPTFYQVAARAPRTGHRAADSRAPQKYLTPLQGPPSWAEMHQSPGAMQMVSNRSPWVNADVR